MKNPIGKIIQLWWLITEGKFYVIFRYFIFSILEVNTLCVILIVTICVICG